MALRDAWEEYISIKCYNQGVLTATYSCGLRASGDQRPTLARKPVSGFMLVWNRCIHDFSEEAPGIARLSLLRFDDMVGNRLVHRLDHICNVWSHVRAEGWHQADEMSEDWNMAEDMTGGHKNLECPFVVLFEVGSIQKPCTRCGIRIASALVKRSKGISTKWFAETVLRDGVGSEAVEWV